MSPAKPVLVAERVGGNLRALREARGKSQDDIARQLRDLGLGWTRTMLAKVERGERGISLSEALHLVAALDTSLKDLLAGTEDVALNKDATINSRGLELALAGPFVGLPNLRVPKLAARLRQIAATSRKAIQDTERRWGSLTRSLSLAEWGAIEQAMLGDAEGKAASRLGEPTTDIAIAAHLTWGRSLTEERDRRVAAREEDGSPRTRQAIRGHVTRELLDELGPMLAKRRRKR